jgi:RimJ/RimL family protein N-acetyltransferase
MMAPMADLVRLRALVERDLPALHRWHQTQALWDHLVGEFQPRGEAEAISYMRRWLAPSRHELRLAVARAEDGALLGLVALTDIEPDLGEAEFHIFLGEADERGKGYGRAATAAALAHAFDELDLWRVRLRVLQTNQAALRVYAVLGFEPHPEVVETVRKGGADVAVVTMSVTDAVFRQRQGAYAPRRSATR